MLIIEHNERILKKRSGKRKKNIPLDGIASTCDIPSTEKLFTKANCYYLVP